VTISLAAVSTNAASKIVKHSIKSGETLYSIAHKYHSTIKDVRDLNGIKEGENLKIGKTLRVVTNVYFPDKKTKTVKIAKTKKEIKKKIVKKEQKTKTIKIVKAKSKNNKKIVKHKKRKSVSKSGTYAVQKGDTLFTIAKKHKMTVAQLVKLNQIKYKSTLKLGQKVKVAANAHLATAKKVVAKKKKTVTKVAKAKKVQHKIKIVKVAKKDRRSNRILRTALKRHAKPLASKRVKRRNIDDIFFTASMPNIMFTGDMSGSTKATKITSLAKKKLGKRYVWGATGRKNTFDCSGLTTYVYKKNGINLPRRAIAQSRVGKRVSRMNLKKGDLVFFDTSKQRKGFVNHVGIYIGNGKFIHASSAKKKVVITSLSKPFYKQRFKWARRL
jgi:cell wall-associated NlpC family hydrolase